MSAGAKLESIKVFTPAFIFLYILHKTTLNRKQAAQAVPLDVYHSVIILGP